MLRRFRDLRWWLEVFVAANLAFLTVDIYVAHSVNHFENPAEWIPFFLSLLAPLLLLPALLGPDYRSGLGRVVGFIVGTLAIGVGLAGMLFHLDSSFFEARTLESLVYAAPFAAPLAYVGIGMLLLVNRLEDADWARWTVFLAFGGFVGNFLLSLLDHAQNGFFYWTEYVPVAASAFGMSFLGVCVVFPPQKELHRATTVVMVLAALVGVLGFGLHVAADLRGIGDTLWDRFVYGAPVFAPLLFPNIAILAFLGLFGMKREAEPAAAAE